uniref:Uncharacterized protein n=1 Tax=Anguilla anguilla TaxID=7936 RepID=A0A0E9STF0_ANGAN
MCTQTHTVDTYAHTLHTCVCS